MTSLDVGLAVAALAALGLAVNRAIAAGRTRRELASQNRQATALHGRFDAERDAHARLREQVLDLAPAIRDAQRRFGFPLGSDVATLVAQVPSDGDSWWLLSNAPGVGALSDGEQATDTFFAREEFTGWVPPQALAAPAVAKNGKSKRVRSSKS